MVAHRTIVCDAQHKEVYEFDYANSSRSMDTNGFLNVVDCNLTKADVNEYWGYEIPGFDPDTGVHELGLDPQQIYHVFRPPEELEKAAAGLNMKPILDEHVAEHNAKKTEQRKRIGTTGSDAYWAEPYIKNHISFWNEGPIKDIESGKRKELSSGYTYTPVLEEGTYNGKKYTVKMVDIDFNHVALVEEGRAGPDVVVRDSNPPNLNSREKGRVMSTKRRGVGDAQPDNELAENRVMAALRQLLNAGEGEVDKFDQIHREAGINPAAGVEGGAKTAERIEATDEEKMTYNRVMDALSSFAPPQQAGTGPESGNALDKQDPEAGKPTYPKTPGQDEVTDPENPDLNGDQHWEDAGQPHAPDLTHHKPPVTGTALDAAAVRRDIMSAIQRKNQALVDVEGLVGSTAKLALTCDSAFDVYTHALQNNGVRVDKGTNLAGMRTAVSLLKHQKNNPKGSHMVGDNKPMNTVEADLTKKLRERVGSVSHFA